MNARSCKHLKSLLGDKYEAARAKLKNPHAPPPKGSPKKKPASKAKAKPPSKRKRADDDDEDDENDTKGAKPAKKARKPPSTAKGKARAKDEEEESDGEGEDDEQPAASKKIVPELLLANKWDIETGPDPTGWWISEKLDGVRYVVPIAAI